MPQFANISKTFMLLDNPEDFMCCFTCLRGQRTTSRKCRYVPRCPETSLRILGIPTCCLSPVIGRFSYEFNVKAIVDSTYVFSAGWLIA